MLLLPFYLHVKYNPLPMSVLVEMAGIARNIPKVRGSLLGHEGYMENIFLMEEKHNRYPCTSFRPNDIVMQVNESLLLD
jgi:hypothetical protein